MARESAVDGDIGTGDERGIRREHVHDDDVDLVEGVGRALRHRRLDEARAHEIDADAAIPDQPKRVETGRAPCAADREHAITRAFVVNTRRVSKKH
jgi:hypothetical protein